MIFNRITNNIQVFEAYIHLLLAFYYEGNFLICHLILVKLLDHLFIYLKLFSDASYEFKE